MQMTPLLYVDEIEPCLPFWQKLLGMEVAAEVEQDGRLGFVLLKRDGSELMVQTRAAVEREAPYFLPYTGPSAALYIDVDTLKPVLGMLDSVDVVRPLYQTTYGTSEIVLREPGGNLVCLAAHE